MATVGMMAYPIPNGYQGYPQHYAMYPTRVQQPHADVGQTMNVHPYAYTAVAQQQQHHHHQQQSQQQQPQMQPQPHPYHHVQPRSPQPSGSPTSDDGSKPSLPSISNLLSFADRPATGRTAQNLQASSTQQQRDQAGSQQVSPRSIPATVVQNVSAGAYPVVEATSSPRDAIPAPHAMRTDSIIESTNSPSTVSTGSNMSGSPYYVGNAINNVEPTDQRTAHLQAIKRHSIPSQANGTPFANNRYTSSPYPNSPSTMSAPAYYSPQPGTYTIPQGLYQQRPLPSNFPPAPPEAQVQSSTALPTSNPWEHHHYISPSSSATFPQSQDRYICTTCNKAFSRPSSLKIHSHSHTGEKPFRCPHSGCGKAFSVRSNMKRHERGCHSGIAGHVAHAHMI